MDTVPRLFMESVCLCLVYRYSIRESIKMPSNWGQICTARSQKIHTLRVYLDENSKKIYAATQHLMNNCCSKADALECVELKFITNFQIETCTFDPRIMIPRWCKEISLDDLQRLVNFIRPVRIERHPLRNDYGSLSTLTLRRGSEWINRRLLSLRFPVDAVYLQVSKECEEADEFFEAAGPLYYFRYEGPVLKESTVDALIDKFIPIDEGRFLMYQSVSKAQIKRLVEKCVFYEKKVWLMVIPDFSTSTIKLTDLFDFDEYYSETEVLEQGMEVRCTNQGEERLKLQVRWLHAGWIEWEWRDASLNWRV
uniref:FTH domain-containing protein n=1 Tax=Steinernema glaseri TaxID=37863 RepID=A0A1I8AMJ7_9BILA